MAPSSPYVDSPPPDIIPQRSPTILRPISLTFSDLALSEHGSPSEHTPDYLDYVEASAVSNPHVESWNPGSQSNTRPSYKRASTTTDISNMPSLSHTPSSSIGTIGSVVLQRSIPSRHNKSYSTHSTRSEDLVNPYATLAPTSSLHLHDARLKSCASTVTAFRVAEAGALSYDKRPSANRRLSSAHGSLKQLFSHEAMKAPPS
ncbi:Life-span regulatory factor [Teratosphaeria destructans]|uniref:Life-span regulatory factor n=1 Tax=Teratosphaeria destructans TaxID=418781 RepID=A0A9W7SVD0_9PEZI|nr:Life-span regulatory factor [Teratosphaeria destructans]